MSLHGKTGTKKNIVPEPRRQSLPVESWLCQSQPSSYCLQSSEITSSFGEPESFSGQSSMSDSSNTKQRSVFFAITLKCHVSKIPKNLLWKEELASFFGLTCIYTMCLTLYRVIDPKSDTLLKCHEESRLQQIAEEKVSNLNSCHWHSELSVGKYLK